MKCHSFLNGIVGIVIFIIVAGLAGLFYGASGCYDIAATSPHMGATRSMISLVRNASVKKHAEGVEVPALDSLSDTLAGFGPYNELCIDCHGAPGIGSEKFAKGLYPHPPSLIHVDSSWTPAQTFWIVKHGFKLTGMPAFEQDLSDEEIWQVVAFLDHLPNVSYQDYLHLQDSLGTGEEEEQ